jgi:toxin ParE1/3/4
MPRRVVLSRRVRNWIDLEVEYLSSRNPTALRRLRERISSAQQILSEHPRIGRRGNVPGTRRLVMVPYVMTYREIRPDIVIVDVRHSRQAERRMPDEAV